MIASRAVGKDLPVSFEEVSTRRLLAYAAGIGDTSAAVFDDRGSLVAAPAFCVSLEWPVLSHPEVGTLFGAEPADYLRAVHVTQDSCFHRAIRPGMRLETGGTVHGVVATGAGALTTLHLETRDDDGPVVTSWVQSLYRGVAIDGEDREIDPVPEVPTVADERAAEIVPIEVARELPHVYSECARIWNPIHTECQVAAAAGLPDIILHGTASWALAGREIVARYADGDPGRLRRLRGRFRAMVIPGSEIELCDRSAPGEEGETFVSFAVHNAEGDEAVSDGFALISD